MPKLLLADDSVTIQRVIELTFADEDIEVMVVGDGKQAIDRILTDRPDIVLADIGMPERDGYDLLREVRMRPPEQGGDLPAVAMTAYARPEDRERAIAAGFQEHVRKPVDPAELLRVLARLAGCDS